MKNIVEFTAYNNNLIFFDESEIIACEDKGDGTVRLYLRDRFFDLNENYEEVMDRLDNT